jgi:hypothetical protein
VSGGVCADCWGVKDPERAIVPPPPEPKTEPFFDWDFDWLWITPLLAWSLLLALVGVLGWVVVEFLR